MDNKTNPYFNVILLQDAGARPSLPAAWIKTWKKLHIVFELIPCCSSLDRPWNAFFWPSVLEGGKIPRNLGQELTAKVRRPILEIKARNKRTCERKSNKAQICLNQKKSFLHRASLQVHDACVMQMFVYCFDLFGFVLPLAVHGPLWKVKTIARRHRDGFTFDDSMLWITTWIVSVTYAITIRCRLCNNSEVGDRCQSQPSRSKYWW